MEEYKFEKIIQNISLDEPLGSFTDNVMKVIESKEALSIDPTLQSILKAELLAEPSSEFSDNLMANIQPKANKTSDSIIPQKIGLIISGIIISILLLVVFNFHSSLNHLNSNSYFPSFDLNLSVTTIGIIKIATTILPYLIPLSVLLLMDYFFRIRKRQLI